MMRKAALFIWVLACFSSCVSSSVSDKETKHAHLFDYKCATAVPSPESLSANFQASVTVFAMPVGRETRGKLASGVVVSRGAGYSFILTAAHVFNKGDKYTVEVTRVLPDGRRQTVPAMLVAVDYNVDLAIVSVSSVFPSVVQLGSSQDLPAGACLYAVSTFRGKVPLVLTRGYLISTATKIEADTGRGNIFPIVLEMYLQIARGSSGGGVFDQQGRLVGIIEAGGLPSSFAVPIENARPILEKLLKKKDKGCD